MASRTQPPEHRCMVCQLTFATPAMHEKHKMTKTHTIETLKSEFPSSRDMFSKDKNGVTVRLHPWKLVVEHYSESHKSKMVVTLSKGAKSAVKIHWCEMFIRVPDLAIQHRKLENGRPILLNPGQNIAIDVVYTPTEPTELVVPIGLMLSNQQNNPTDGVFYIIKDLELEFRPADLLIEETLGQHGDLDMMLYDGEFPECTKFYSVDKVRTGNASALPMPKFRTIQRGLIPDHALSMIQALEINNDRTLDDNLLDYQKELRGLVNEPTNKKNYITKMYIMLSLEQIAQNIKLRRHNLGEVKIKGDDNDIYEVFLPCLAEKKPNLNVGFTVWVRENIRSTVVYEGVITGIQDCRCFFRVSGAFRSIFMECRKYSIEFRFNNITFQMMITALGGCIKKVFADAACSYLFPQKRSFRSLYPLLENFVLNNLVLFDKAVEKNPEQLNAVKNILSGRHRPAPFILFGPPGTGKTSTLAEAIKQVVTIQRSSRILVCASSNSACDVICEKLLIDLKTEELFRVYSASFDLRNMSPSIEEHGCHNYRSGTVMFPDHEGLSQYRIIVATLATSFRFSMLPPEFFSHVIIDECAFSMEPESLIPIYGSLRDWKPEYQSKPGQHLILAGDIKQLGPVLSSTICSQPLSISLMERLMADKRAPYQKPFNKIYIVKLLMNYRSHRDILEIPNRLFYDSELLVFANISVSHTFAGWRKLPNPKVPLIFHNCVAMERKDVYSTSFFNIRECEVVLGYVIRLTNDFRNIAHSDIGVISPYAAQCRRMKSVLIRHNFYDVKVGTVEEFQGQERRVIIISTVRSSKDLLQSDLKQKLGFLKNPKRFNVALTRAQGLLICVGNSSVLSRDEYWGEFIKYAKDLKAWCGLPDEISTLGYKFNARQQRP